MLSNSVMLKTAISSISLLALWLMLSGLFKPLLLLLGVSSALLAGWLAYRMDKIDGEELHVSILPLKFATYVVWLVKEIAVSSVNVTQIICGSSLKFNQKLFSVPTNQESELAQVIFANSITLTPGTVTVETEPGYFLVHALDHSPDDFEALEDMDRRIGKTGNQKKSTE